MKERIHALIEKRLRNRRSELRGALAGSAELREVESALRRLEQRTYGICRRCGTAIAHHRLYGQPHTECCSQCAPA